MEEEARLGDKTITRIISSTGVTELTSERTDS